MSTTDFQQIYFHYTVSQLSEKFRLLFTWFQAEIQKEDKKQFLVIRTQIGSRIGYVTGGVTTATDARSVISGSVPTSIAYHQW